MAGSVYQRKGQKTWTAKYERSRDPLTGKRRPGYAAGFATKREAERWLRKTLTSLDEGTFVEPTKRTGRDFLQDDWLPLLDGLRATTRNSYWRQMELHVIPHLGEVPLQRLSPA